MFRKAIYLHPAQSVGADVISVNGQTMAAIFDRARQLRRAVRVEALKKDGTTRAFLVGNPSKAALAAVKGTGSEPNYSATQRRVWDASCNGWRVLDLARTYRIKCGSTFVLDNSAR